MAWIESHIELESHPKLFDLMAEMNWDIDTAIGKLHRFWWWCLRYALDGDLSNHRDERLAQSVGLAPADGPMFVSAMIIAGFINDSPHRAVHDWMDYAGTYLSGAVRQKKYRQGKRNDVLRNGDSNNDNSSVTVTATNQPTNHTNHTNQPTKAAIDIPEDLKTDSEIIETWLAYKQEKGQSYKPRGLNALWSVIRKIPAQQRKQAVEQSMANNWSGIFQQRGGNFVGQTKFKSSTTGISAEGGYQTTKQSII